jgi:hypothetical protein
MLVVSRSPISASIAPASARAAEQVLTIKVGYDFDAKGEARLRIQPSELTPMLRGARSEIRYPTDFGEPKACCDVVLIGAALDHRDAPAELVAGGLTTRRPVDGWLGAIEPWWPPTDSAAGAQVSPADQQVASLDLPMRLAYTRGALRFAANLPAPAPECAVLDASGWNAPSMVRLVADTLLFAPVEQRCFVIYRGIFLVPEGVIEPVLAIDATAPLRSSRPVDMLHWREVTLAVPIVARKPVEPDAPRASPEPSDRPERPDVDFDPQSETTAVMNVEPEPGVPRMRRPARTLSMTAEQHRSAMELNPSPPPSDPSTPKPHRTPLLLERLPDHIEDSLSSTVALDPSSPFSKVSPLPLWALPSREATVMLAPWDLVPRAKDVRPLSTTNVGSERVDEETTVTGVIALPDPTSAKPAPANSRLTQEVREDLQDDESDLEIIPGMTAAEFAGMRATIWSEESARARTLDEHGVSELRWRIVGAELARQAADYVARAETPLGDLQTDA